MNGNINKEALTVTSVGNAWVICNSESRPGLKYYFNTLSGQAVWNLSAEDIEKAKRFTKALPISEIEKCPEPTMDPPMEAWAQQSGQQCLNDQATRQPPPPTPNMLSMNLFNNLPGLTATPNNMAGLPTNMNMQGVPANINMPGLPTNINNTPGLTANLTNMPQMPAVLNNLPQMPANSNNMPHIQAHLNNMPHIQANLNNLLGQNMTGLTPFVWNTGNNPIQTQPVIYVVTQQPAVIPLQQMPQNVPPQDISYNNSNQTEQTPATVNQGLNRRRIDLDDNKLDLRHKLTRKRCKSESQDSSYCKMDTDQPIFSQERKQNFLSTNKPEEKAPKFDLSVLNQLKPSGSTLLNWLIVIDVEMILQNFAFLNKLIDPDQNCYLMVPDHVMDDLEQLVDGGTDMPTRRILRFLKEQIELELAFRADEVKDSTDSCYKLYATCKALADRNNVVLLSDDPNLEEYKYDHKNIHVFKLQELNNFLTNFKRRKAFRFKSPTLNIKIHVPNDRRCRGEEEEEGQTRSPFIFNQVANSGGGNIQPATSSSTNRVPEKTNPQLPKKKQTDSSQAQDLESVGNIRIHKASHEPQTSRATLLTQNSTHEVYSHTVPDKTAEPIKHETNSLSQSSANDRSRHIVLCRNSQSTSNTENNNRQSKYRWRKKTTAPNSEAPKTSKQSSQMEPPLSQEEPVSEEQQHDTNVMENIPIPDISPARERSEQSSISSCLPPPDRPNIIVEETSTSGIISTSSEIDIILRKSSVSSSARETLSASDDVNFIRYQVVGETMEEVLKTRREEWVLRFVQIMEEALKDTLRASLPSETDINYAASWATDLPDLAKCIVQKFIHHHQVVDAANRLSFTLYRISDEKGNVCANIEPRQYMDMYSYGVYLIESLKQVIENCDDLTASAETLKKLMYDIQNASQECSHNDTFMDKLTIDENIGTRTDVNTPRSPLVRSISNVEKGSLNFDVEKAPLQPQFSNIESNFLSNLSLTRISTDRSLHTPSSTPNSARIAPSRISSPKTPASPKITPVIAVQATTASNVTENSNKSEDEKSNKDAEETPVPTDTNQQTSEIKIVRKFVNIPHLEEKLDKIQNDNNSIDNEDNYEDDEYYDENEVEDGEIQEVEEEQKEVNNSEDASKDAGAYKKVLIKDFVQELMSPIGVVKTTCKKMVDDLKKSRKPSPEMQTKLESSLSLMKTLENALQRIIDRKEAAEKNKDIASLLKTASLHSQEHNKDLYNRAFKECWKQVRTYHYIATQVVAACKQQVT